MRRMGKTSRIQLNEFSNIYWIRYILRMTVYRICLYVTDLVQYTHIYNSSSIRIKFYLFHFSRKAPISIKSTKPKQCYLNEYWTFYKNWIIFCFINHAALASTNQSHIFMCVSNDKVQSCGWLIPRSDSIKCHSDAIYNTFDSKFLFTLHWATQFWVMRFDMYYRVIEATAGQE